MDITKVYELLLELEANINAVKQGQAVIEHESSSIENVGNNTITIENDVDIIFLLALVRIFL